jgi:hypothetical protein
VSGSLIVKTKIPYISDRGFFRPSARKDVQEMLKKRLLQCAVVSVLVVAAVPPALSQQVECAITVNTESVPTTNRDRVRDFADVLTSYVSNYSYGAAEIKDKIVCTMNVDRKSTRLNSSH